MSFDNLLQEDMIRHDPGFAYLLNLGVPISAITKDNLISLYELYPEAFI